MPDDEQPGPFIYHGLRHHAPFTRDYDTLEEAVYGAMMDEAYGEAVPERIMDAAGNVLLEGEAFREARWKREEQMMKDSSAWRRPRSC